MPNEPTATLPPPRRGGLLFEALLAARVDPALAHGAADEVADAAGGNVVAQITTHVDAQISEVKAQVGVLEARLEEKINGTNRLLKALITLIAALTGALLMLLGMYILGIIYEITQSNHFGLPLLLPTLSEG